MPDVCQGGTHVSVTNGKNLNGGTAPSHCFLTDPEHELAPPILNVRPGNGTAINNNQGWDVTGAVRAVCHANR